jgi:prepilin-type N-terminal cleavage/methylation domain-containing protein
MKKKGFTLIELVVVMAIIAVLAALIIGAIIVARNAATQTQNRGNAKTIQTGFEAWYTRNKTYPAMSDVTFPVAATNLNNLTLSIGSCANGGGVVTSTTSGYTITVYDNTCTDTMETITGP